MASTRSGSDRHRANYGNMKLVIEVEGKYRTEDKTALIGTLEAKINFMADDPAFTYPDVEFTPHNNYPLTQSQAENVVDLMQNLDQLRRHIGIKAGHKSMHIKKLEDYLRV